MTIELSPEDEKQAIASLRRFCDEELETGIGDVQARQLLRYILREIAPTAYNAGIAAAEAYVRERVSDLEGVCSLPEFAYWPKGSSVRRR